MRLLEPLNGVKMAQGHYMTHLVFFVTMLLINTEWHEKLMVEKADNHKPAKDHITDDGEHTELYMHLFESEESEFQNGERLWFEEDDLQFLSGGGHGHAAHHHVPTPAERAQAEMEVFNYLKWSHLCTFLFTLIMLFAKSAQYYNLAQTIHCLIVGPISILAILLAIFITKNNQLYWLGEATEVRIWIMIDVFFFFCWIASGCLFVTLAYIFKFKSTMKNEEVLLQDDNPWNDKDTEDFLRHLKMEYLMFSYFVAAIVMDYVIGFHEGKDFGTGKKEFYPSKAIMGIDMIMKAVDLLTLGSLSVLHANVNQSKLRLCILTVFDLGMGAWIYYIYYTTDSMAGQNKFCKLWAHTIMIQVFFEPFWMVFKLYFESVLENRLLEYVANIVDKPQETSEHDPFAHGHGHALNKSDDGSGSENEGGEEQKMTKAEKKQALKDKILNRTKSAAQQRLEDHIADKNILEIEEEHTDISVICLLSYLKKNQQEFLIHPEKRAQMLYTAICVQGIVFTMLCCMSYGMYINEEHQTYEFSHSFTIFFIKLPCTIALHLLLYPEVAIGLEIMKFANQNPGQFVRNGSQIAFILGFIQVLMALFCECINITLLTYQHTTDHCIIHFVALEVIMDVSNFYAESMMENKLKDFVMEAPKPHRDRIYFNNKDTNDWQIIEEKRHDNDEGETWFITDPKTGEKREFNKDTEEWRYKSGTDQFFGQRSCFHKLARMVYKLTRCFYVGLVFYFVPFATLFMQFGFSASAAEKNAAGGGHGGGATPAHH